MDRRTLEREIESRVEAMGYEFVELDRAGTRTRPVLRVRIDFPDSRPGEGVTLDDCAKVSRALEPFLDSLPNLEGSYVIEVSSPGVERPLIRPRDFERFKGREVAVRGYGILAGRSRRLEGELLGLAEANGEERVRLRLPDGEEVEIARSEISRVHLVFRWK